MNLTYRVLGTAGRDNALLVQINGGQSTERLLFDCGDGCLSELSFAEIQSIDRLFFSHLHMDHIGGFDSFFRCTFQRTTKLNRISGPPDTSRILQHRFQGFLWNLHDEMSASWLIDDIYPEEIRTSRLELSEAFAIRHDEGVRKSEQEAAVGAGFTIETLTMDHRTPTLAYLVREHPRRNIDVTRLPALGLRPGAWLKQLKDGAAETTELLIDGKSYPVSELQRELLIETPGDSIAYLTDFLLDDAAFERLGEFLRGCQVIVCEAQYRHADLELAQRNHHMTSILAATLADRVGAQELVLFHLSERYDRADWEEMLREAQEVFPKTSYPASWGIESTKSA